MSISDRFICMQKDRSAAANLQYVKLTPHTGTTSNHSENCVFRFMSNRQGYYLDPSQSFISYKVTSSDTGLTLSPSGCGSFIEQTQLRCGGNLLTEISQYQAWRNYNTKTSVDEEFLKKDGNIMMGTLTKTLGEVLVSGRVFTDFLSNFSSLFQTDCYIPLNSADGLELSIKWGNANYPFKYPVGGDSNAHLAKSNALVFSEITLNLAVVSVAPAIDAEIIRAHNNLFKYYCNSVKLLPSTVQAGANDLVMPLGASFTSMVRVDVLFVESGISTMELPYSTFEKGGLTSFGLLLDGQYIAISAGVDHSHSAVSLAMARAARHGLSDTDMYQIGNLTEYEAGAFVASIDCESIVGKEHLRSGINTSASNVSAVFKWAGGASKTYQVLAYVYHDAMISMDLSGSRLWEMSQ